MSWIAIRDTLLDDPAVIQIAGELGLDEYGVVGRLVRLWTWADQHTTDGNVDSVTTAWVDRFLGTPGFAAAMLHAGWLRSRSAGVEFPNFGRWNTQPTKSRLTSARRVEVHRRKRKGNAFGNGPRVTEPLPEKRREEKKEEPPNPPQAGGGAGGSAKRKLGRAAADPPGFAEFWSAYPRKTARAAAVKAFAALSPDDALLAAILAALAAQRTWDAWTRDGGKYIPHPATWLNAERWADEPPAITTPPPATRPQVTYDPPPAAPTAPLTVDFLTPKPTLEKPGAIATEPADW